MPDRSKVSQDRWESAQRYERGFWQATSSQIAAGVEGHLNFYDWRAGRLQGRLHALGLHDLTGGAARVLEIGTGPVGIVSYFPATERVGVDPLEAFYAGDERLTEWRNPAVRYLKGRGEQLPCESDHFDLVIIDNCIDHVQDATAVMRETRRVLRPGGTLYLTVNCRTLWGYWVHRAISTLRVDAGHPHTFTARRVRTLIETSGFRLREFEVASFVKAWRSDLTARQLRPGLKALLGISEFVATAVAQRLA